MKDVEIHDSLVAAERMLPNRKTEVKRDRIQLTPNLQLRTALEESGDAVSHKLMKLNTDRAQLCLVTQPVEDIHGIMGNAKSRKLG